jgi:hypothetical protein
MFEGSGVSLCPASGGGEVDKNGWGSLRQFQRLTGVGEDVSLYWLATVHRPAHRIAHPLLSVRDCPGCAFEQAVA